MSVDELLATLSAREVMEWRLLEGIEPFGERRADWRAAVTTALLAQVQGSKLTAKQILGDLTEIFEQPDGTIDDDAARNARIESALLAYAGVSKKD